MPVKQFKPNPKPFIIAGYVVIALTFGVVGLWAATAKLDKAVIAHGEVDVATNRKEIQHLEGGIIRKILVKEGQKVKEGDVLIELNDIQTSSNLQVVTIRLRIAQATEARLQAERNLTESLVFPNELLTDYTPEVVAAIADQQQIFADRTSILKSQKNILVSRIDQLKREAQGLDEQKSAFEVRAGILSDRLERLRGGLENGAVQVNLFATYEDEYVSVKANVARMDTEKAKVENSIGETEFQILQTQQQFQERASSEYKEINGQIQELVEQRKVSEDILSRTRIRAPVDGVAQNLQLNGPVIRPGQIMLEIVPATDNMVINARVATIDIDNVREGMTAEVKFSAFQSRFLPIITGEVETVSQASITPSDSRQPPYFLARINVSKGMIPDELEGRLNAGMPAEVMFSAGERTVVQYLTAPLTDAIWKSMNEE